MNKIINSKYGLLIFSLLSGLGYFTLIMVLLAEIKYSYLLGIFFFPAIVCGAAVCIYKSVKTLVEAEEYNKIKRIFVIHSALIVFSLILGTMGLSLK